MNATEIWQQGRTWQLMGIILPLPDIVYKGDDIEGQRGQQTEC